MSYGQRVATYGQFTEILANSAEAGFRHAPSADQLSGLMEGVTVVLRLQEMSVDYAESIAENPRDHYVPRHRVHATVLFDYGTYTVDVKESDWFALPSVDQWQAALPIIELPAETVDKLLGETPEPKAGTDKGDEDGTAGAPAVTPDPEPGPDAAHQAKVASAAKRVGRTSQGVSKRLADHDTEADLPSEASVG